MKKLFLGLLGIAGIFSTNAQSFAKGIGSTGSDIGRSIAVDAAGNVYTIGTFIGTVDFDPGAGIANLVSAGSGDIFISKLDAAGNYVWAKSFGGASINDVGNDIALDASGNVYGTGYFTGTVDFDPGAGTTNLVSAGGVDIFVLKLDAAGSFTWAKNMGGTGNEISFSITTDASGNVYSTGYFAGTADFDPGAGIINLVSAGNTDIFVSKLDASGNYVWAKSMSGIGNEQGNSIAVDASGNVYTTGFFGGTVDFNPGVATFSLASAGSDDIFMSKLDASGNYVWAKNIGGINQDQGSCIKIAGANIYITGTFSSTIDFDPGAATVNLVNAGSNDIFVSKFDVAGNFVWAKGMGSTSIDVGKGIAVDGSGNIYTSGYYNATADFDPGAGTANLVSAGGNDIFISKLDASGNYVWAKTIGGTSSDIGYADAVDAAGNIYTTGTFDGTADFDPDAGILNLISAGGGNDIFISKLNLLGQVSVAATGLNFDGVDDKISLTSPMGLPVGNSTYTIESWIKPQDPSVPHGIVGWGNYGNFNEVNAFRTRTTAEGVGLVNYWWGNDLYATAGFNLFDGSWHHVAVTYDGTDRKIYVDGIVRAQDVPSSTTHTVPATNFTIGSTNNGEYFKGDMDEVRIWDRAMSQSEIQNNMNCEMNPSSQTGLQFLYHFNQGYVGENNALYNIAIDVSGKSNNGALNNFALSGTTSNWVAGAVSATCTGVATGLNFDGVDDRVSIANQPVSNLNNFTVEGWVYSTSTLQQTIYSEGFAGNDNPMFSLAKHPSGFEIVLRNGSGVGLVAAGTTGSIPLNTWTHVAFVRTSATTGSLYINGTNTDNFTFADPGAIPVNVANLGVRQRSGFDSYFIGSMDEIRIWNRSLCQAEIQNNMNGELNPALQTGLKEYYRFNQGMPAVSNADNIKLIDLSGNNYNGTLNNFALTGAASNWVAGTLTGSAAVYTPSVLAATSGGIQVCQSATVQVPGTNYLDDNCNLIAVVNPSGASPVAGTVNTCAKIDASVQTYNGQPYVQRHYDITPATNAATATGTVTLYFTQAEFNAYNTARGSYPALPTGSADATGISKLLITQFHGTGTVPGNYSGTSVLINPVDANIVWNSTLSRWQITIDVNGFSGFYVHTSINGGPLPLTLLQFTGRSEGNNKILEWITSNEINIKQFVIERSNDISFFKEIATVNSKGMGGNAYSYSDMYSQEGIIYYRLKIVDLDGRLSYSNIITLTNKQGIGITIYPNPVLDKITLQIGDKKLIGTSAKIIDATGKTVQTFNIKNNFETVDMSALPAGLYLLQTINGGSQKLIKE